MYELTIRTSPMRYHDMFATTYRNNNASTTLADDSPNRLQVVRR